MTNRSNLTRRTAILSAGAALTLPAAKVLSADKKPMPAIYAHHGSPDMIVDDVFAEGMRKWGASLPKPTGIVSITPHVRSEAIEIGQIGLPYTLYSFPAHFKSVVAPRDYVPPDNTALAGIVEEALQRRYRPLRGQYRGVNHTCWMPLYHMLPKADVPLLELPMPLLSDPELFAFGQALAPLREQGILLMASGTLTHNLALIMGSDEEGEPEPWASDFDNWYAEQAASGDIDALINWRIAPGARLAHPDDGAHYRVSLIALGAAAGESGRIASAHFPTKGFNGPYSSRRSTQFS